MSTRTLCSAAGLHILAVDTPKTAIRDTARGLVRTALRAELARLLAVGEAQIELLSAPGAPLRLAPPWSQIGLSVSHEPGLSLAAIHRHGAVGIDLMRVDASLADLEPIAADYLGPVSARAIAGLPLAARPAAFAKAWTELEARLKCLGRPLEEWTPTRDAAFETCTLAALEMPDGWVASLAIRPATPP